MTSPTRTVKHVDGDTTPIEVATYLFAFGIGLVIAGAAWISSLRPDPEPPAEAAWEDPWGPVTTDLVEAEVVAADVVNACAPAPPEMAGRPVPCPEGRPGCTVLHLAHA